MVYQAIYGCVDLLCCLDFVLSKFLEDNILVDPISAYYKQILSKCLFYVSDGRRGCRFSLDSHEVPLQDRISHFTNIHMTDYNRILSEDMQMSLST